MKWGWLMPSFRDLKGKPIEAELLPPFDAVVSAEAIAERELVKAAVEEYRPR